MIQNNNYKHTKTWKQDFSAKFKMWSKQGKPKINASDALRQMVVMASLDMGTIKRNVAMFMRKYERDAPRTTTRLVQQLNKADVQLWH